MENCVSSAALDAARTRLDAAEAARETILLQHIANGVIIDSRTVQIAPDVQIAPGAVILAGTILRGHTIIGAGCIIGPNTLIEDSIVQRIVLALHRDEHTVAGAQAVEGEQIQTGRAVDKDEVVVLLHLSQRLAQTPFTAGQVDHFQAGAGQTGVGADDIGAVLGVPDGLRRRCTADEHLISARFYAALWDAIACGGVALRVKIYDKHLFAQRRYAGRKVDGGGGFAHSALLVCDRYNFCHALFFLPGKDLFHMEHAVVPAGFPVRQAPWLLV